MLSHLSSAVRRCIRNRVALAPLILVLVPGVAQAGPAGGKGKRDTAPPSVSITAPAAGATVTATASVMGSASDNVGVAKIEVSVDGGAFQAASGTTSWSAAIDTRNYTNGTHTVAARAADAAGNKSPLASVAVTVSNTAPATSPPPPPPAPPADTTAPSIAIAAPTAAATVSGEVTVSGTATDDTALARVDLSVDGGSYQTASGTGSWVFGLNTATYADGGHTLTARATDTSGNVVTSRESVTFSNSSLPPGVAEQMVTPEGATIQIYSDVTGWKAQQVYDLLKPNAYQLGLVGPHLTVKVQTTSPSSTSASAVKLNGVYSSYKASVYLQAKGGTTFMSHPDAIVAHEYGHAWTLYHLYMSQQGDWTAYLSARGILGDPRLDSTYNWSKNEMIADDYRLLFGTPAAQDGLAYINPQVPDPRSVPGLRDFLATVWATP